LQSYSGQEDLYCVYVPTNHLYIGDILMVNSKDVIRPILSVREGIGNTLISHLSASFNYLLQEMRWGRRILHISVCRDCCIWWDVNAPNSINPGALGDPW
jgi:hypothetical protein